MTFFILLTAETKTHLDTYISHYVPILYHTLTLAYCTHSLLLSHTLNANLHPHPYTLNYFHFTPVKSATTCQTLHSLEMTVLMLHCDSDLYIMQSTSSSSRTEPSGTLRAQPFYQVKNSKTDGDKKVKYLLRQIRSAVIYVTWVSEMGLLVHPVGMFLTTLTRNESEDLSLQCFFPTILQGFPVNPVQRLAVSFCATALNSLLTFFSSHSYISTGSFFFWTHLCAFQLN